VRVTYIGPLPPIRGGISQHGAKVVAALRAEGCEVETISWRSQYPPFLFKGRPADVRGAGVDGTRFSLRWWNPFSWIDAGRRGRSADLVVFPWVTMVHAVHLRTILAVAGSTPSVAIVHNPRPHEPMPFDRALLRLVLSRVRGAVVHSRDNQDELQTLVPIRRVLSVPHPPNLEIEPAPFPSRPPLRLLFLGFVRPYKGLDVALDAVAILARRDVDVELTVAGEFWEPLTGWEARVRELGLAERVRLRAGYVADEDMDGLLASHHLLVAPYKSVTQSGVAPLAFAAGRPVVATTVGGLPEVVREGRTGALAEPSSPSDFADAIERAAADLEALGTGAAAAAGSWGDVARAVLEAAE
jgi:glycosyltransferase involved in cell wall biosynthesis